ncbi:MAG: type II toxin-antitoxin system RelE/ParE family toxin, partial [Bdellovibrionales bacterium]
IDNPSKGVSIPGAGGVKKIRVSRANEGKSGGYRVFYLDLQEHGIVHLLFFITKGEKDNITNSERNELKAAADFLKKVAKQRK